MIRILILCILVIHTVFSLYVSFTHGYWSAFPPFESLPTTQIFFDLVISLGIVFLLLFVEAKRRNRPLTRLIVCGVGAIFLGSIAPLIYLLIEKDIYS